MEINLRAFTGKDEKTTVGVPENIASRQEELTAPKQTFLGSLFDKLPQWAQDVGTQIKKGFTGEDRDIEIAFGNKERTGFQLPSGAYPDLFKSRNARIEERYNALKAEGVEDSRGFRAEINR